MNTIEAIDLLAADLQRKNYSPKTITLYSDWIKKLCKFYPDTTIEQIGQKQVEDFISHLINRKQVASASIHQAFHAYRYLLNDILNRGLDFEKIKKPKRERSNPDIFTPEEIYKLITTTRNIKHKLMFAIAYSSGLELSETRNIRLCDIDLIREKVKVRDSRDRIKREALLSKFTKKIYEEHLLMFTPKKFVFESNLTGQRLSTVTMRRVLVDQARKIGIAKKVGFKALKYSYVIHLYQFGKPILYTLDELKMGSTQSLDFFMRIALRDVKNRVFSPLDMIAIKADIESPINIEYLEESIRKIKDKDEADYLKEALVCMNAGSLRAGIIFAWNAAVLKLRKKCFSHGTATLNSVIRKHYPKAKDITKMDDFSYLQDSTLLLVAQDLGEISKAEKDSLEDCLDTRNKCGHPGVYRPKAMKSASVIEELISIVFK